MERRYYSQHNLEIPETQKFDEENVSIHAVEQIVFDASLLQEQEEVKKTMSYADWKENGYQAEPGTVITGIPPRDLFTPQDWLDPEKAIRAHLAQQEMVDDAYVVKGIAYTHPKEHMGVVPVVLEGNHRSVNAHINKERINFEVIDSEIPQNTPVWRITNLANKYNDWYSKGL